MSAPKKLDNQLEVQVVAIIARGDKTYPEIVDWLKQEHGVEISVKTVSVIKNRNAKALELMKSKIVSHEMTHSTSLLSKARQLLDTKLDKAANIEKELATLKQQLDDGEIDDKEYWNYREVVLRSGISVKDLVAITKETFNQSQIEAGKPTSITESPEQAKENLRTLLTALANGDQTAALKAIFPDA